MTAWRFEDLDPRLAAKASLPTRVPIPAEFAEGEQIELNRARVAAWAADYLAANPGADPALERLVAKEADWRAAEQPLLTEDWASAIPPLLRILAVDPGDGAARFNLASAQRGAGHPREALDTLRELADVFGDEGVYHANVARTYEALGDRDAAVDAYRKALELLPGDAFTLERLTALGELVQAVGPEGEAIYVDAADFADSVRQDLAQHAEDADYLVGVADVLLAQGQPDLARNAAELALAAQPDRPDALLLAGVAHAALGHGDQALALLDRHVAAEPRSAAGHSNRARLLHEAGRTPEARAAADTALGLDPNDLTAVQAAVAGDDGAAAVLARLELVISKAPDAWAPWRVAGDVVLTTGDHEAALGRWRRAVDLGADDLTIGMYLGELGRAGRVDELVEIADGLSRLADREPGLRWNAASGYEEAGRMAEAKIVFASIAHDQRVPGDLRAAAEQRARADA